jgi:Uma2 family endonuclease
MSQSLPHLPSKDGEPAWEAAYFFPPQGRWSEETFLQFHTNQMAELVDGRLEILPMPTWLHQLILEFFFDRFREHVRGKNLGGKTLMAPLPTKLFPGTIREPDLLYVCPENLPADIRGYPHKIDLAIEIVSEGAEAHKRDYEDKRVDYAKAGVAEYWIVDPQVRIVTVLTLRGSEYDVAQECHAGETANSLLLPGLAIVTSDIWTLAEQN